ncbi:LPXTG cell wall anchor domain-containing protein [Lacrimispora brassicae]
MKIKKVLSLLLAVYLLILIFPAAAFALDESAEKFSLSGSETVIESPSVEEQAAEEQEVISAGGSESEAAETETAETEAAETGAAETETAETDAAETGASEAEAAETEASETSEAAEVETAEAEASAEEEPTEDPDLLELDLLDSFPIEIDIETVSGSGNGYIFNNDILSFTGSATGNEYVLTGTSATRRIVVENGADTQIMIKDLHIEANDEPAFELQNNARLTLILEGMNTLKSQGIGFTNTAGLSVSAGTEINISGDGKLEAIGGELGAGIGGGYYGAGGTIIISDKAVVTAKGDFYGAGIGAGFGGAGGTVTICDDAVVDVTGPYGAGIGGGCSGAGSTITISDRANVNATGGWTGAGIGGDYGGAGGTITISGDAVVNATGGEFGAGIGGGDSGAGGTITISDRVAVTAKSILFGAGIGGGYYGAGGTITISDDTVVDAKSSWAGAGIGGGYEGDGGTITISGNAVVEATGGAYEGAGIGGGTNGNPANIHIGSAVVVKAYARNVAAIHASGNNNGIGGDVGYYVNVYFDNPDFSGMHSAVDRNNETEFRIFNTNQKTGPLKLPADYTSFAYTTRNTNPEDSKIFAYNMGGTALGTVVTVAGDLPQIGSVNTNAVLPVKLVSLPAPFAGTPSAVNVTQTSAELINTGHYLDGDVFLSGRFQYSTQTDAAGKLTGSIVTVLWDHDQSAPVTKGVIGLTPDTKYYLQTCLSTDTGEYLSTVVSFTTLSSSGGGGGNSGGEPGGGETGNGGSETGSSGNKETGGASTPRPVPAPSPGTHNPGNRLEPQADGDVPLGTWILGDDGQWIFDEAVPLDGLPKTGESRDLSIAAILMLASMSALIYLFVKRKKLSA